MRVATFRKKKMEIIRFDKDIPIMFVDAALFPEGVLEAHQALHKKISFDANRKYFGLSRPENGIIRYKAAAEELEKGEAIKNNFKSMVIREGRYRCVLLKNYQEDIESIGRTFTELIHANDIDPEGYCVEWYQGEHDMYCMVRLRDFLL